MTMLPRRLSSCFVLLLYSIIIIVISQQVPWRIIIQTPNPGGSNSPQVHELIRERDNQSAKTLVNNDSKRRPVVFDKHFVKNNKKELLQKYNDGEVSKDNEKFAQNGGFWNLSYEDRSEVRSY